MISELDIRKLTDEGIEKFRNYLAALRAESTAPPPYDLLTDSRTSRRIEGEGRIKPVAFETRLDMARYLDDALSGIVESGIENDIHLWTWLSLLFIDQVCPADKSGKRTPGRDYRHILEPGYPYGHRHLIGGAYLIYSVYGWGEEISQLLLYTSPHVESKFNHELAGRQSFITNRGIMQAAHQLYFEHAKKKPKRGAQIKKKIPGSLYRFIDVVQQLELNFDLYSMTGDEIIDLLPPEFDQWK